MPFTIRPYRRLPVPCAVPHNTAPYHGQGTIWNLSYASWRLLGDLPIREVSALGHLLSGLLMLVSCGDPSYQVRQSLPDGAMPPEGNWVAVDSAYQFPDRETVYFDPETMHRDGDFVTLWHLTDYKWMQGNVVFGQFMMGPNRFLSTKAHKEFDCTTKRVWLLFNGLSNPLGGTYNQVRPHSASGYRPPAPQARVRSEQVA